jgi:hypothetical protein
MELNARVKMRFPETPGVAFNRVINRHGQTGKATTGYDETDGVLKK